MRFLLFIIITVIIFGCSTKPRYTTQSPTGIEVGLSKRTNKSFRLVDKNSSIIAKINAQGKKLVFNLPSNVSPSTCYTIIDDEGNYLFAQNTGIKITSIYDFNQKQEQLRRAQSDNRQCIENEKFYSQNYQTLDINLSNNELFNGKTCNLPARRDVPPFPQTICGSHYQCQQLANDSCMKNLADAEACGLALSATQMHSSITSVSCGALLSSLNGEQYGIGTGVQDAITGYLDQHTKNMIDDGEYGKAFTTGLIRLAFTYYRVESCKETFFNAAYAPIENWTNQKNYIEREPYIKQNACNQLIREYNSSYENFVKSKACIQETDKSIVMLSSALQKLKNSTSAPEKCSFK